MTCDSPLCKMCGRLDSVLSYGREGAAYATFDEVRRPWWQRLLRPGVVYRRRYLTREEAMRETADFA